MRTQKNAVSTKRERVQSENREQKRTNRDQKSTKNIPLDTPETTPPDTSFRDIEIEIVQNLNNSKPREENAPQELDPATLVLDQRISQEIVKFAMAQMTIEQIGHGIGLSPKNFLALREKYPYIDIAIKRAKLIPIRSIANRLIDIAVIGDVPAAKFILERKGGWINKQQVELTGENGTPINSMQINTSMTLEEAQQHYNKLICESKE